VVASLASPIAPVRFYESHRTQKRLHRVYPLWCVRSARANGSGVFVGDGAMADDDPDNDGIYFDAILNGVRARFFHREDNPPRSCPWCGAHHSGAQCPPDRESAEGRIRV
jgi:hypothetical protein